MAVPRHFAVLAVLLLILLSSAAATGAPKCRFNFCASRLVYPDADDKSLTSLICLGRRRIGIVITNSSLVRTTNGGPFTPLEDFSPRGLSQSFAPTFFKAFPRREGGSAVGIQAPAPQGNQGDFVSGLSVALSVTAYQILKDGKVVDNVYIKDVRPLVDCILFKAQVKPRRPSDRPVRTAAPTERPTRVITRTEQTSGTVVEKANQDMPMYSLPKSVWKVGQVVDADVSNCTAQGIDVTFKPELPFTLGAGPAGMVRQTVKANKSACSADGTGFSCQIKFTRGNITTNTLTLDLKGLRQC